MLEHLPIGIVATDADGEVTVVNSAATTLLPDYMRAHAQHSNEPTRSELVVRPRRGTSRNVVVSSVPPRDARGALVGSVTALDDVTADRAIAAERENVANFHQQMVGIVGHDLRNPLNAVTMCIGLLEESACSIRIAAAARPRGITPGSASTSSTRSSSRIARSSRTRRRPDSA